MNEQDGTLERRSASVLASALSRSTYFHGGSWCVKHSRKSLHHGQRHMEVLGIFRGIPQAPWSALAMLHTLQRRFTRYSHITRRTTAAERLCAGSARFPNAFSYHLMSWTERQVSKVLKSLVV